MWPILGPIEYNQTHQSTNFNFNHVQRLLFDGKSSKDQIDIKNKLIKSNIRYIDPISLTCLIIYSLILLLLCALPILALNIYLRQALDTFHQNNQLQIDD